MFLFQKGNLPLCFGPFKMYKTDPHQVLRKIAFPEFRKGNWTVGGKLAFRPFSQEEALSWTIRMKRGVFLPKHFANLPKTMASRVTEQFQSAKSLTTNVP